MYKVPYENTVGSLMYLLVCTRPYLVNPGKSHWEAVKWILRYLKGTKHVGLVFLNQSNDLKSCIKGNVDVDYAKDVDSGRLVTGYAFQVKGNIVSWKSQLQHIVALSTTEVEYIALTKVVKEGLWLKGFASNFGIKLDETVIFCDNSGAVQLS